ncbi:phosphoglucomutase (alpha-D-glucose-1,6-bisphosphate-dependent) [Agaribacter flavus]|uniref:Phosphoglucomutase n=1 Tax=Agaribacter flavus TaxID=1902781 RepID=A0ABV7FMD4_9ALTE
MPPHSMAGKLPAQAQLINVAKLVTDYYRFVPDPNEPTQAVSFGTSGHRGTSSNCSFNDTHIAAISQALAEYRVKHDITGPMFVGKDTHALSEPAMVTAIEVLCANGITVYVQLDNGFTPTPVISQRIVSYNRERKSGFADGVVITPSHNPPTDGGFKYNQLHGGPADSQATTEIQQRANEIISSQSKAVKRMDIKRCFGSALVKEIDFSDDYIESLSKVIDMQAIANAGIKLGTDPLGGSGLAYWDKIAEHYGLSIDVVNPSLDQRFAFMPCDHDGKIRMDCSSPFAMSGLIKLKDNYDIAFGNDPDFDRHGIVTPSAGLMNPNHYLSVAINYLYQHRSDWSSLLSVGKTLVSSSMIDRVAHKLGRDLVEMPVGFKWFVEGLSKQTIGFAGEESAGGIFLQRDGKTWATDKDGFILSLLAAEITAVTSKDPGEHYKQLTQSFGEPVYQRIDVATSLEEKQRLSSVDSSAITATEIAGEEIVNVQSKAPGNDAKIGGLKVSTENGWFAARPSGTEDVYKIYAESFRDEAHLQTLLNEAQSLVSETLK